MKKLIILLIVLLASTACYAAAPSRDNTYVAGTTIRAADVTANEDAIFTYLQAGVDTFKDGTIFNADIASSAAIAASKLNLSSISDNITLSGSLTHSGAFSNTDTASFSSASFTAITNLGSVTTGDINGGTIDGTIIGQASPAAFTGTVVQVNTTFKLGTTNQGDILYDNGTSITRLAPGTDGYFLKTQGAGANPAWAEVTPSAYATGFGNLTSATEQSSTQATTDGFILLLYQGGCSQSTTYWVKTDSANPPTTIVAQESGGSGTYFTLTVPIKKNNYYLTGDEDGTCSSNHYVTYWLPVS